MDRGPIPSAVLNNPNVDGIKLRWWWNQLEPSENGFDWTGLDGEVAQARSAHKKISLSIGAGYHTPAWVYSDGAAKFSFVFDQPWGPGYCAIAEMPIPWDPVFLQKWTKLISALGAHYGPSFAYVNITGFNSTTHELMLPIHVAGQPINGGQCQSYNDIANWQAVGYTRTKIEAAWKLLEQQSAALENMVGGMFVSTGFPPLDDNGNRIPNSDFDVQVVMNLVDYGIAQYPGQNLAQNNALSPTRAGWPYINQVASRTVTGYQMARAWGNSDDLLRAGDLGIQAGADYLEIYMSDITNPNEAGALSQLHSSMAGN